MSTIDFPLTTDPDRQLLLGVMYAESSTVGTGGEDDREKKAIALAFINEAYYATFKPKPTAHCYNSSYGDGTILQAIEKNAKAYGGKRWNEVMNGNALKTKEELQKLDAGKIAHLKQCAVVLDDIASLIGPVSDPDLGNREPLHFNKATDKPPNPQRHEKIGRLGSHTFYAFKVGRECQ